MKNAPYVMKPLQGPHTNTQTLTTNKKTTLSVLFVCVFLYFSLSLKLNLSLAHSLALSLNHSCYLSIYLSISLSSACLVIVFTISYKFIPDCVYDQTDSHSDWHFKDVLHFFKTSVTNDKACIRTISEREVDGALIQSMNDKEN